MPHRSRPWWSVQASLFALLAYLALPGVHLLQKAHQARGALELAMCGASPALVAKLRALPPGSLPLPNDGASNASDERACQNPSVCAGSLAVAARPYVPDWSALRHERASPVRIASTHDAASRLPRVRGPPLLPAPYAGLDRA